MKNLIKAIRKIITRDPLVSLCMVVRNGMPYVAEALESVRNQTYQKIELIIQDCCSTDGTIETINQFAKSVSFPVHLVSEKDDGIADAINRAWTRCNGSISAVIEADNLFLPNHIQTGVDFFKQNPDIAIIYTAQKMIDAKGTALHDWVPDDYDFLKVLDLRLVPPSGSSIMQRKKLGKDLRYNTSKELGHVPDYEFWMRVGYKGYKIKRLTDVTFCTRLSPQSGSCQIDRYDEFIKSKIFIAEHFFSTHDLSKYPEASLNHTKSGIILWAAWHIYSAEGLSERFKSLMKEAYELHPDSEQLKTLEKRSDYQPQQENNGTS